MVVCGCAYMVVYDCVWLGVYGCVSGCNLYDWVSVCGLCMVMCVVVWDLYDCVGLCVWVCVWLFGVVWDCVFV